MAASDASVCNIALARIGQRQFIASLDEPSSQAKVCKVFYADARDAVLARAWWPFATRHVSLSSPAGVTRLEWAVVYLLPADCIEARYIYPGGRRVDDSSIVPFAVEDDATVGPVIVTDQTGAELCYTARFTNPVRFPPLFTEALAWKLAVDLTLALPVKPQVAALLERKYEEAIATAMAVAGNNQQRDQRPEADAVRIR